jgi:hypothetical protein
MDMNTLLSAAQVRILSLCITEKQRSMTYMQIYIHALRTKPLHKQYLKKNINPILLTWLCIVVFQVLFPQPYSFTIREFSIQCLGQKYVMVSDP